jgi:hypothetical protein
VVFLFALFGSLIWTTTSAIVRLYVNV